MSSCCIFPHINIPVKVNSYINLKYLNILTPNIIKIDDIVDKNDMGF